jgi:hypothetical protein
MDHRVRKDQVVVLLEHPDQVEYKVHKDLLVLPVSVDKDQQDQVDHKEHSQEL